MADREVHLEPEPDRPELSVVDEPEVALPPVPPTKGQRRTLMIVLAIIAAVVVYALAFDYTDVDRPSSPEFSGRWPGPNWSPTTRRG